MTFGQQNYGGCCIQIFAKSIYHETESSCKKVGSECIVWVDTDFYLFSMQIFRQSPKYFKLELSY